MDFKITIVIPAFNAGQTIGRTLKSLLSSSIRVKVMVVNDGSEDDTATVVSHISAQHENISLISQSNAGAYQARLNALKHVTTPYFGFVDADDEVSATMFEKMLRAAEAVDADVVQCGHVEGDIKFAATTGRELLETRQDVLDEYVLPRLVDGREGAFIWDKIYRNRYEFGGFAKADGLTNFDDYLMNLQFFENVERMAFVNEPLYRYSTSDCSATHTYSERKFRDFKKAICLREALLLRYGIAGNDPLVKRWKRRNRATSIKTVLRSKNSPWRKIAFIARLLSL